MNWQAVSRSSCELPSHAPVSSQSGSEWRGI